MKRLFLFVLLLLATLTANGAALSPVTRNQFTTNANPSGPTIPGPVWTAAPVALYGGGLPSIGLYTNSGPALDYNAGQFRILGGHDLGIGSIGLYNQGGSEQFLYTKTFSAGQGGVYANQFNAVSNNYGFRGMGVDLAVPFYVGGNPLSKMLPTPPQIYTCWWEMHTNVNSTSISNIAAWLVTTGMKDAGFDSISLDDGWAASARSGGHITWNTTKFPAGIAPVAAHLHSLGMKLIIYTSGLTELTCENLPGTPSRYVVQDVMDFASWGCDGIKVDRCGAVEATDYYNTREGVLFANAILNQSYLSGYGGTNQQRMALIVSHERNQPTDGLTARNEWKAYGTMNISEDAVPFSSATTASNANNHALQAYNDREYLGPGHYQELLGLYTGGTNGNGFNLSTNDNGLRAFQTLGALWSSPPIIGGFGYTNLWAFTNREVNSIMRDPLNLSKISYSSNFWGFQWFKPLDTSHATNYRGATAVALVNVSFTNKAFTVTPAQLGFSSNSVFDVRDAWYQTNVGRFGDAFTFTVTPTNTALLRATIVSDKVGSFTYTNFPVYRTDGVLMKTEGEAAGGYYAFFGAPSSGLPTGQNYNLLMGSDLTRLNVGSGGTLQAYINNGTMIYNASTSGWLFGVPVTGDGTGMTNTSRAQLLGYNLTPGFNTTTRYYNFVGGDAGGQTTEAIAAQPCAGGTLTNLTVQGFGVVAGTNVAFTIFTNGVATAITANFNGNGAARVVALDTTHSCFVTNGSAISMRIIGNNASISAANVTASWSVEITK